MHIRKISLLCLLVLFIFGTVADARIVFSSRRDDGIKVIYVMDDDGSNQTLIREDGDRGLPAIPSWSPDGQLIAFEGILQGYGLYVMHPDGTNVRKLPTPKGHSVGRVSFSPDSKSLVFKMRAKIDGKHKHSVNVMNIETGEIKEISDVIAINCDLSPDGELIAFSKPGVVGQHNSSTIWVMGSEGQNPRKLIPPPLRGRFKGPRWSPDGKQLVYLYDDYAWERRPEVGAGVFLIYKAHRYLICDRNGKNIKQLRIRKDWRPIQIDWMDDGESVVFSAYTELPLDEPGPPPDQFPTANIYKYHIRSHTITRLTDHPGVDQTVDWISDDVLPVFPKGKKKVTWGKLKQ